MALRAGARFPPRRVYDFASSPRGILTIVLETRNPPFAQVADAVKNTVTLRLFEDVLREEEREVLRNASYAVRHLGPRTGPGPLQLIRMVAIVCARLGRRLDEAVPVILEGESRLPTSYS